MERAAVGAAKKSSTPEPRYTTWQLNGWAGNARWLFFIMYKSI